MCVRLVQILLVGGNMHSNGARARVQWEVVRVCGGIEVGRKCGAV